MKLLFKQRMFSWFDSYDIYDEDGNPMESCPHPKQIIYVDLGMELDQYDILRRKED